MKKELNLGVLFTGKVDATFLSAVKGIQEKLNALDQSSKKAAQSTSSFGQAISMNIPFLHQYLGSLEKILKAQMAWYGAKALLFGAVELPRAAISSIVKYAAEVDQAKAEMIRWGASSGEVTKKMVTDAEDVVLAIRRASLEYPVAMKDLSKAMQAFVGAGVDMDTVRQIVPLVAQLKTAFKEIDFEQFAVAVTGAFNTFRHQIKLGRDDAEKFQIIIEQMLRAQAVGVIRPEQFTKVLQYLGQVSNLAGFTTEQMFAMATAITNTGNQAANASRLMAGLMQSMSGPKFRKAVEADIGVKLDRSVSLAKQFDQLMGSIVAKMGKGEPVPLGWLEWISGVTSADRSKIFMTFIQQYEKYTSLTKDIAGASGGLAAASEIMKMPLGEQWKLFLNVLHEIGLALTRGDTITGLKELMAVTLDIAKGFLAALDNGRMFPDLFYKLGDAGKRTYEIITSLSSALGTVFSVIGPVIGMFAKLAEWLMKVPGLIEILSTAVLVRLVIGALTPLILALKSVILGIGVQLTGAMVTSSLAVTPLTASLISLRLALTGILGPLGLIALAVAGLVYVWSEWRAEMERLENNQKNFDADIDKLAGKSLDDRIAAQRAKLDALKKEEKLVIDEFGNTSWSNPKQKELEQTLKFIGELENKRRELSRSTAGGAEHKPGTPPPPEKTKDLRSSLIAADKAFQNAELSRLKSMYALERSYLDEANALKLVSEEKYDTDRLELIDREANAELKVVNETTAEIEDAYQKSRGKEKDAQKRTVLDAQYRRDMKQQELKETQIVNKAKMDSEKIYSEAVIRLRTDELAQITHIEKMKLKASALTYEAQKFYIDELGKDLENKYANNQISEEDYYRGLRALVDANQASEVQAVNAAYDAWHVTWQKRMDQAGDYKYLQAQLLREEAEKFQETEDKKTKIHQDATTKNLDIERRYRNELQTIYNEGGAWAIIKKKMDDMYGKSNQYVVNFATLVESEFKNLETTLETVFFDALEGRCKSFSDYWKDFAKLLRQTLAKYLAAESMTFLFGGSGGGSSLMGGLLGLFRGMGGSVDLSNWSSFEGMTASGVHEGGVIGVTPPTFTRIVPASLFDNAPRYHRGMNNDEVAAILKKRETVLTEEDVGAIKAGLMKPGYSYNVGPIVVSQDEEKRNRRLRSEIDKTTRRVLREAL